MAVVAAGRRTEAVVRRVQDVVGIDALVGAIVAVGVVLRLVQYLAGRSLRVDEAMLALNVMRRPLGELGGTLDFNQAAPFGFLVLSKAVTAVLGDGERAFRLVPLLAGIAALLLFPRAARAYLSGPAVVLAVALFAVADGVVFYASDFKPYSLDVLAALLVLLAADRFLAGPPGTRTALALGLAATVLVWLTYASVFVLAAAAVVLVTASVRAGDRRAGRSLLLAGAPLALSVAAVLAYSLSSTRSLRQTFGQGSEGVLGGRESLAEFGGSAAANLGLTRTEPWSLLTKLAFVLLLVGLAALLRRDLGRAVLLALPVVLVSAASLAGTYPVFARTILFLVPATAILIAAGVEAVAGATARAGPVVPAALAAAVLAAPAAAAVDGLDGRDREATRSVLADVRAHWRDGDRLYVHYGAAHAFAYYVSCGCFSLERPGGGILPWRGEPAGAGWQFATPIVPDDPSVEVGRYHDDRWQDYVDEVAPLRGRVWVVVGSARNAAEAVFLDGPYVAALDRQGTRLARYDEGAARAYLFRLRS